MLFPKKTSSLESNVKGPNLLLIPYLVTMLLARLVTLSRSFDAPVDISSRLISSETLPPNRTINSCNISPFVA